MADIRNLPGDIRKLLSGGKLPDAFSDIEHHFEFAKTSATAVAKAIQPPDLTYKRDPDTLYASEVGAQCVRKLKYARTHPEWQEPLPAATRMKFLYGNVIEGMLILLAKLSGHDVRDEQKAVELVTPNGNRVRGRIDAVIDGVVVEVKSVASHGFKKMLNNHYWDDPFGYQWQLCTYRAVEQKEGIFLIQDKQNGQIGFAYENPNIDWDDVAYVADGILEELKKPVEDLNRLEPKLHSKGKILDTTCSYCPFKKACWADANGGAGLKAYKYSTGPVFFVEESRPVGMPEIKLDEKEEDSGAV